MRCTCGEVELGVAAPEGEVPTAELAGVLHRANGPCRHLDPEWGHLVEVEDASRPHIAALVRPGDTLIVGIDGTVTMDDADRWRRAILNQIPGLADVVILANGYVTAVYRPDDRPPATIDADGR